MRFSAVISNWVVWPECDDLVRMNPRIAFSKCDETRDWRITTTRYWEIRKKRGNGKTCERYSIDLSTYFYRHARSQITKTERTRTLLLAVNRSRRYCFFTLETFIVTTIPSRTPFRIGPANRFAYPSCLVFGPYDALRLSRPHPRGPFQLALLRIPTSPSHSSRYDVSRARLCDRRSSEWPPVFVNGSRVYTRGTLKRDNTLKQPDWFWIVFQLLLLFRERTTVLRVYGREIVSIRKSEIRHRPHL